jgi:hypothetical protein
LSGLVPITLLACRLLGLGTLPWLRKQAGNTFFGSFRSYEWVEAQG